MLLDRGGLARVGGWGSPTINSLETSLGPPRRLKKNIQNFTQGKRKFVRLQNERHWRLEGNIGAPVLNCKECNGP